MKTPFLIHILPYRFVYNTTFSYFNPTIPLKRYALITFKITFIVFLFLITAHRFNGAVALNGL